MKFILLAFAFFAFVSFYQKATIVGKWFIRGIQDVRADQKIESTTCSYFEFSAGGNYNQDIGFDLETGSWKQNGDTMMIRLDNETPTGHLKILLLTKDSLVFQPLDEGSSHLRFHLNTKCNFSK